MVTPDDSVPQKSNGYLYAQSVFFVQFNDVDFYVEDSERESLYFCILTKFFPDVRIDRIFPLGGKTAVLKHVQVNPLNRKSLYLVDKDFDDLLGIALSLPNLVYLDRYCIENYVLEPKAIYRLVVGQKPSLTIARAKKDFDVQSFLQTSIIDLRLLFLLFFLVQKHALGIQGAGQPAARFADDRVRWRISRPKVEQYRTEIEKQLSVIGIDLADEVKNYDTQFELSESEDLVGENVSGKHLVALTLLKIRSIFRTPGVSVDSATFRLAEYCGFEDLESVAHRIAAIIGT
jgi:Protein of unknown function (DUF4435)